MSSFRLFFSFCCLTSSSPSSCLCWSLFASLFIVDLSFNKFQFESIHVQLNQLIRYFTRTIQARVHFQHSFMTSILHDVNELLVCVDINVIPLHFWRLSIFLAYFHKSAFPISSRSAEHLIDFRWKAQVPHYRLIEARSVGCDVWCLHMATIWDKEMPEIPHNFKWFKFFSFEDDRAKLSVKVEII